MRCPVPVPISRIIAVIHQIAKELESAKRLATTAKRPGQIFPGFNLEQGYAVGSLLDAHLRNQGCRPAGRKIGFTNPATWDEFGMTTPIWAYIYEQTVRFSSSVETETTVSTADLVQPRIETELVLQVNHRIGEAGPDPQELIRAVEWIAIGFEIVQCHYRGWKFSVAEAVADFCLHSELVVGPKVRLDSFQPNNLVNEMETFQVELQKNSQSEARGSGQMVLGSPLRALGFLLEVLSSQPQASPLQPGEIVTTGTMTPILPIEAGESWSAGVSGLDLGGLSITVV